MLRAIQDLTTQEYEQAVLTRPALSRDLDEVITSRGPFQPLHTFRPALNDP